MYRFIYQKIREENGELKAVPEFQYLTDFDLSEYQDLIREITTINWNNVCFNRKDGLGLVGRSSVIFYDFLGTEHDLYGQDLPSTVIDIKEKTQQIIINDMLKKFDGFVPVKGEISCCMPQTLQKYHVDPRVFHRYCKRIHLPLLTNDQAYLSIGYENYHLELGKIYEFDNTVLHRSVNLGKTKRIHIILDIIDRRDLDKCLDFFQDDFFSSVNKDFKWRSLD